MSLFSRFRRSDDRDPIAIPQILPSINQRVTVTRGSDQPVPSRVDDEDNGALVLASPNLALDIGDMLTITWESPNGWYSFESHVEAIQEISTRPTVTVSKAGRLTKFNDRRSDLRQPLSLPLDLRVVMARVVKPGTNLRTRTIELSSKALRFTTSAPFAPGDVIETRVALNDMDIVSIRVKVIRMDSVSGSWRQTCTALFDDILRSDRARIVAFLEAAERESSHAH